MAADACHAKRRALCAECNGLACMCFPEPRELAACAATDA